MIANAYKKMVVDRAGFSYFPQIKGFAVANLFSRLTRNVALPKLMANQIGPVRDGNLRTGPDHKRMEVRHG